MHELKERHVYDIPGGDTSQIVSNSGFFANETKLIPRGIEIRSKHYDVQIHRLASSSVRVYSLHGNPNILAASLSH